MMSQGQPEHQSREREGPLAEPAPGRGRRRGALARRLDGDDRDVRPGDLQECMHGVKGSLRLVGDISEDGLTTVYFRPPKRYLEDQTLLTLLRRRLSGATNSAAQRPAPHVVG